MEWDCVPQGGMDEASTGDAFGWEIWDDGVIDVPDPEGDAFGRR